MALLPFSSHIISPSKSYGFSSPSHIRLQKPPLILRAFCSSSSPSSSSPLSTSNIGLCIRKDSAKTRAPDELRAPPEIRAVSEIRDSEAFPEARFHTTAECPIPDDKVETGIRNLEEISEIRVPKAFPETMYEETVTEIRASDGTLETRFEETAPEIRVSETFSGTRYLTSSAESPLPHSGEISFTNRSVGMDSNLGFQMALETLTSSPSPPSPPSSSASASSSSSSSSSSSFPIPSAALQSRDSRSKVVRTAWEALVRWSRSWQLLNAKKATNVLQTTKKVVVIGGGSFGTAMAVLLARNKTEMQVSLLLRDVSLSESINKDHVNRKYFPKHKLPHNIVATTNAQEAFKDSEFCIHAVPVQYSAEFLKSISEHVPVNLPFFSVSKGLELSTLEMMSQVIPRALGNQRQPIAVISGPSFSIELMDELPTAMVVASKDKELARSAQQLLASRYLRINTSSDVIGVEIAGALKNVLAIAAGIVEGMNLGNNCMAALVAQGCSEIRWLAEKMGAKSTTLAGLSGTGDIMLTCFVNLSRNRTVGVRLGAGESLSEILSSMNQVAEGVATAGAVIALARKYRVQMPVLTAVARILENELTPKKAVLELMSLPQVEEV